MDSLVAPARESRLKDVNQRPPSRDRVAAPAEELIAQPGPFFDENGALFADWTCAHHRASQSVSCDVPSTPDRGRNHGPDAPACFATTSSALPSSAVAGSPNARRVASRYARPHLWSGSR